MLSYEWTVQKLVLKVYDYLQQKEILLWMDIKAGISSDNLYEGISEAVENTNCFEPSRWLGLITAGLVWLDFYHINNLSKKASRLYNRICKTTEIQSQSSEDVKVQEREMIQKPASQSLRTYSSCRPNKTLKQWEMDKNDGNNSVRHSLRNPNNQRLFEISDKSTVKYNTNKNPFQNQIHRPNKTIQRSINDMNLIVKETRRENIVSTQNRRIQHRPLTTKPSYNSYNAPFAWNLPSMNDDSGKEEEDEEDDDDNEQNACKVRW
ncbi:hypothetical protein I4U23_027162 [Adineta vaga]|nr:hypothetical protein I4U23_027162 [Adineta vaga]